MGATLNFSDPMTVTLVGVVAAAIVLALTTIIKTHRAPYGVIDRPYRGSHYKLIAATYAALKTKRPICVHPPLSHIVGVSPKLKGTARRSAELRLAGITVPVVVSHPKTLAAEMVLLDRHWKQCTGELRSRYKVIEKVCQRAGIPVVYPLPEDGDVAVASEAIVQAFKEASVQPERKAIPILDKLTSGSVQPMQAIAPKASVPA